MQKMHVYKTRTRTNEERCKILWIFEISIFYLVLALLARKKKTVLKYIYVLITESGTKIANMSLLILWQIAVYHNLTLIEAFKLVNQWYFALNFELLASNWITDLSFSWSKPEFRQLNCLHKLIEFQYMSSLVKQHQSISQGKQIPYDIGFRYQTIDKPMTFLLRVPFLTFSSLVDKYIKNENWIHESVEKYWNI